MNRTDSHRRRSRHARHGVLVVLLLPACFHTRYLQDDAGVSHDAARVELDAASGPDAFSAAQCPASYDLALPGPSRYRLIATAARAWEHSDTCVQDLPGATHLVILETAAEVASVQALVDQPPVTLTSSGVWIGGVQLNTATTADESWIGFDGGPLINDAWYIVSGDREPNNGGKDEASDPLEQFISMVGGKTGLNDANGNNTKGALCECDGQPIAASAAAAIDSYRAP